jgi:hypothetical protein
MHGLLKCQNMSFFICLGYHKQNYNRGNASLITRLILFAAIKLLGLTICHPVIVL